MTIHKECPTARPKEPDFETLLPRLVDKVFEWLHRAYEARDVNLIYLPVDPRWDPYRDEPRFTSLLAEAGFR